METPQDFKSLQEGIQKALVSTVKSVNRLAAEDLTFQRTVNPEVAEQLDDKSARVLELSSRLLQSAAKSCGIKAPRLEEVEDIDMSWQSIVDVVDSILEKADTALDEYTGLVKRKEPPNADSTPKSKRAKSTGKVIRNANVTKPQTLFEKKPNNFPIGPWKPILTCKPHSIVPLEESLVTSSKDDGNEQYKHPYEPEILKMNYPKRIFRRDDPIPSQPTESTKATWVDTYDGVLDMLKDLKKAKEIAVDLEHHDFRTYTGLVCLMQVSTREKDWIVDTLQPWRHRLEILNEVFADPKIVKVFHGAYMDMVWLQRDLGLYVNGLFDTYFACDLLQYPGKSLAFLLSKFVNFDADKQYQLADWRIRPIPEEMMYYARSDTHYLLYIFDNVRNELIEASDRIDAEKNYIKEALERSRELSLSRHEHPDYNETTGEGSRGWYNYVLKHSHLAFNGEQFAIFKALWKWRDETARKEDESPNFVLGTTNVTEIARVDPPDGKALHSLLPLTAPHARARLNDIWSCVQEAKSQGGPSLLQFFTSMAPDIKAHGRAPRLPRQRAQLSNCEDEEISIASMSQSKLFGSMPISSRWEDAKESSADLENSVPFPWQRFVHDSATADEVQQGDTVAEEQPTTAQTSKANTDVEEPDEEFTLKRGRQRKSQPQADENEGSSSSTSEDSESEEEEQAPDDANGIISLVDKAPKRSRRERKFDKEQKDELKRARRAKKQEKRRQQQETQKKKYDAVPFDYSKAATVLHSSRGLGGKAQQNREPKRVFDPYSKTGDEPLKGARKMPPVRGERSATFKK